VEKSGEFDWRNLRKTGIYMDLYGFIWIYMDLYGFIWIYMDLTTKIQTVICFPKKNMGFT